MALCLDTEVNPSFGERDLDLPSADVQGYDVCGLKGDVGAEEGLGIAFAVRIADQDPSGR